MIPTSNAQAFSAAYRAALLREQAGRERADRAEQECRDRECTEQDVRARLADAENALARVRALFGGGPDTPCRTTWDDGMECVEVPMVDLREALDGTS